MSEHKKIKELKRQITNLNQAIVNYKKVIKKLKPKPIETVIYDGSNKFNFNLYINPDYTTDEIPEDNNIKKLVLCDYPKFTLPNLINLTELTIKNTFNADIPETLINLRKLEIIECRKNINIPNTLINLREIRFRGYWNKAYWANIPNTLINLEKLVYSYSSRLIIPDTLINLNLLDIRDVTSNIIIPNTLTNLLVLNYLNMFMPEELIIPDTLNNLFHIMWRAPGFTIPETLINLQTIEAFSDTITLHKTFTNLKKIDLYGKTKLSYIPEEYTKLRKVRTRLLFHKPDRKIKYRKNKKYSYEAFERLYNTLIRMQRTTRLKIFKRTHKTLYNPLYIGGYLGKKRLEKVFMS
jgi:hypothetical protein